MPQRSSGILWLVLALLSGLVTLGVCGLGGFSIWHTHSNVQMAQAGVDRNMREMEQLAPIANLPQNQRRFQELNNLVREGLRMEAGFKGDRMVAFVIAGFSILPGLLALVFVGIFAMKRFSN